MTGSRIGYTILMVIAATLAAMILRKRQRGLPLPAADKWTLAVSGVVGATLAAKLPFWFFAQTLSPAILPFPGVAWLADGKTILWALAGGYLGVEVGKWMLDIRVRTGDTFVVAVAVAVGVGRLGCLVYGCCHGTPTDLPWGIRFSIAEDGGTIARHPTQVYESIFHLTFACLAAWSIRRNWMTGDWMPIYLIGYAIYRFCSEYIRAETPWVAGLTFYQISAVPIAVVMLAIIIWRRLRREKGRSLMDATRLGIRATNEIQNRKSTR